MRALLAGLVAALAVVLNPLAACDWLVPVHYDYSEADMRAAVEGKWELVDGDTHTPITIKEASAPVHASAGLISTASACGGSRSFVAEAHACEPVSRMTLTATADDGTVLDGELIVPGPTFRAGELEIRGTLRGEKITSAIEIGRDGKVINAFDNQGVKLRRR